MSGRRGCASVVARILAGVAAAAFIVSLPLTLLARNIAVVIFEPRALTQVVSDRLIASGLLRRTVVDNVLGGQASLEGLNLQSATRYLTAEERESMIDLLVPEAWVTDQMLRVTTEFLAWFDTPATRLVVSVDTRPLSAALGGEAAARVVETIVASWPECTADDVNRLLGIGDVPGQEGFPYCEPPEPLRGVLVRSVSGALRILGESLPANLPIVDRDFRDTGNLLQVKEQVRLVRFVSALGNPGFPVAPGCDHGTGRAIVARACALVGDPAPAGRLDRVSSGADGRRVPPPACGTDDGRARCDPCAHRAGTGHDGRAPCSGVATAGSAGSGRQRPRLAAVCVVTRRTPGSEADPGACPRNSFRLSPPVVQPTEPKDPKDRPSGMFG